VRDQLAAARVEHADTEALSAISRESVADTIYEIDRLSEEAIEAWFLDHWPADLPVELVMEGVDPGHPVTIPAGTEVGDTTVKCIIDPIDGTRGLMYDKRPAFFLAAAAPQQGPDTSLRDLEVAVMTELPTTKQWRADRFSAIRGRGVQADSVNLLTRESLPLRVQPSRAERMLHGYGYISRFLPAGKALTATLEERVWELLYGAETGNEIVIFEDQYISTGGQFYELLSGHDRMIADLRPLVFRKLGITSALCCHPYDVAGSLILDEAGLVIEDPVSGGPPDGPLDTISPVSWVAYANPALAAHIRPALQQALQELL
jgi:hypothetical protein